MSVSALLIRRSAAHRCCMRQSDDLPAAQQQSSRPPLFVDLDGTLLKTDLLHEALLGLVRQSIAYVFLIPLWLLKGRAYLKSRVASLVDLNVDLLPHNEEFVRFLGEEKRRDRVLYLATAANQTYADKVARRFGLFDGVIASNDAINLKGEVKAKRCIEMCGKFSYAGNDSADFAIFANAEERFLVNPTRGALRLSRRMLITRVWGAPSASPRVWLRALRIHQWAKNLLLFVPLLAAHKYFEPMSVLVAAAGFVAFSLLASATYIVNDLLDLQSDRTHPRKRSRPFAAGDLRISEGFAAALLLLGASAGVTLTLPPAFGLTLLAYGVGTFSYSAVLKTYVLLDVIALAGLYTLRIIAGAMLLGVTPSFWLLAFSMFTFFGLALVKRCAELRALQANNARRATGREYSIDDYLVMQTFGVAAAFASVLVMAFFIEASLSSAIYGRPMLLWLVLPAYGYWFCRMWLKTSRMEMHDDPIVFSVRDRGSLITIAFICLVVVAARFL
jgi:4-hydroxybenzoate polyprenyltransferase